MGTRRPSGIFQPPGAQATSITVIWSRAGAIWQATKRCQIKR